MKILVVGAGIVGAIYGWAIAEAGHDVTHFVRSGRAARLSKGIPIDMLDRRKGHKKRFIGHYAIRATEEFDGLDDLDLVIVPTKHYHLVDALRQIVPHTGGADYLLLTQNWVGTDEIDPLLPQTRYVFGDAKAGGTFCDGTLVATLSSVDIGQVGGRQDMCLQKAVALFESADIKATLHENILHYLWVQYAITGGLWPSLVRAGSIEAVLRDRQLGELSLDAVGECLEVIERRGVDLGKFPETRMYRNTSFISRQIMAITMTVMFRFDEYMRRSSAHGLSDPQEIQAFYDDLLNTGKALGVPMLALSSFQSDIEGFAASHALQSAHAG